MKITIAGAGRVGNVIARQLIKEKHDVTIVDINKDCIDTVSNSLDVLPVLGDAASAQVLLDAGVNESELMISVTNSDVVNLLICIVAKKIGVKNTIARIREPLYLQTIALIKDDMGLSFVVNPEKDTAKEIFGSLLFKDASQVETFAQGSNEVMTCIIREKNPLAGQSIRNLSRFAGKKILVCAIKRDGQVFIPNADTVFKVGDTISFVATRSDAVHFFKKMKYESGRIKDLTIIGAGKLVYYLAQMAVSNGIPVSIIDRDPEHCQKLVDSLPDAVVMCGDGTDTAVLEECGVLQASAVVTCTDSDEKNVLISMYIKKHCPDTKVITKIKKTDFEDMLYGIDIGNLFNPKYIAADRIITYVRAMQETVGNEVQSLCHVIDNKVEVLEFKIDEAAPNLGIPLQNIRFKSDILLASITRNGVSFIPGANDTVEIGDTVLVVTTRKGIGRFTEIFSR